MKRGILRYVVYASPSPSHQRSAQARWRRHSGDAARGSAAAAANAWVEVHGGLIMLGAAREVDLDAERSNVSASGERVVIWVAVWIITSWIPELIQD